MKDIIFTTEKNGQYHETGGITLTKEEIVSQLRENRVVTLSLVRGQASDNSRSHISFDNGHILFCHSVFFVDCGMVTSVWDASWGDFRQPFTPYDKNEIDCIRVSIATLPQL